MAPPKPCKERKLARKLRLEDGKSFGEISQLTGIDKSTISRWAKSEGWPDPRGPRAELKEIVDQATKKKKPQKEPEYLPPAKGQDSQGKTEIIPDGMPDVNFEADSESLADQLFRWSMKALQNVARFSVPTLVKFAEISARVHIAQHTPKPGEERKLTVMIPAQTESYRGAPDE